jgi:endonuclease YncB( thermonuclease family)
MARRVWPAALVVALLAAAGPLHAELFFDARVVGVADGDTIDVVRELEGGGKERLRIRLSGIDAPEKGQPWGRRAREALSKRAFGKEVRINAVATDRYGRTVGEVYADDVCVACELLREGHVWVFRRYTDDRVLLGLEAEARAARRGLWSLPEQERIPPWEWRGASTRSEVRPAVDLAPETDFVCGGKRFCREMRSCAEARFHLERCGLTRLDGDGDGTPCETLCGGS